MNYIKKYSHILRNRSFKFLNKRRGWRTNRKIIVIESDDWGSIRMPSLDVYNKMMNDNLDRENIYSKYDSLATKDDFSMLYDVLVKYEDINGNNPIVTANVCVANPDFKKIKDHNFEKYFYEPFTDTLRNYPECSFDIWEEGIEKQLIKPQLHGREHLNISKWLKLLQEGNQEVLKSFDYENWGARFKNKDKELDSVVEEFLVNDEYSILQHKQIIKESAVLFKNIFGFKSKSFIAPNYIWNVELNSTLKEIGIDVLQGSYFQNESSKGNINNSIPHYIGEINDLNQIYLVRNCMWEPSQYSKSSTENCLIEIEEAFKFNKPAIICAHRLNFIGAIVPQNRNNNLRQFSVLLSAILKKWPDVEFMSSDQLGQVIKESLN